MPLSEFIYKRRSVRKYSATPVSSDVLEKIEKFCENVTPLYPDVKIRLKILPRENIHCFFKWTPQQALALFSEEADGYLENAGFVLQQAELYLQSLGLGACWLGLAKQRIGAEATNGLRFVIMIGFGYPEGPLFREREAFDRKPLCEISDEQDVRLECARLAPSSTNSQPWYFVHDGENVHTYCSKKGLLRMLALGNMNKIDMGIALAHIYLENTDAFRFFKTDDAKEVKGHSYIGSFRI